MKRLTLLIICLWATSPYLHSQESQLIAGLHEPKEPYVSNEDPNSAKAKGILNHFVKNYLSYNSDKYIYVGCNEQNEYYENDTVRMRRISHDYYPVWQCCKFVEWNLVADSRFLWSDLEACKKGVQRSYYLSTTNIKATLQDKEIYLDVSRNGSVIERFKVIRVDEADSKHNELPDPVLVLLRVSHSG
ncbi:hypothetical protein LVD17_20330 [Fulvivirga ulvae]|uniref:hypothetical protein n=1 Tax=Fulvivirga ulvae TaxID=2904245 RepID=UPI001F1FC346|nr:hypothetical protein [Fulvivirga ulvae]UII30644.1 hypothetical protein LVD17_20330 [Fulvivirga ulvae]